VTENAEPYGVVDVILTLRGQKVILDSDLARLYGVETKNLNKAVARNQYRFPVDFVFRLTVDGATSLRFHFGTSNPHHADEDIAQDGNMRFQIGTASRRNIRYLPFAFTEHGAIMAANVLRSRKAAEMSVFVVRAFVRMRQALLSSHEREKRLDQIEKILLTHDAALKDLYEQIRPLLLPPLDPPPRKIGFHVREARSKYKVGRKS
jgi:hypothetical protein